MQKQLIEYLQENSSKISFTFDGWSSRNLDHYFGLTGQFIDKNWQLKSIALDLIPAKKQYSGSDMSKLFLQTLKKFNLLKKIGGITVDNASSNNTFFDNLNDLLHSEDVLDFNKTLDHYRCLAHILNLGDTLKFLRFRAEEESSESNSETELESDVLDEDVNEVTDLITKVRNIFRKIRNSSLLIGELRDFCQPFKIQFIKPILDCRTRWNSSLDMLTVFRDLKLSIKSLCENNSEMRNYRISDIEWEAIDIIISYLRIFKQVSDLLSAEKYPTLPVAVLAFNVLLDKVEKIVFDLDKKINRNRLDEILIGAFQEGRDKILKHYRLCN